MTSDEPGREQLPPEDHDARCECPACMVGWSDVKPGRGLSWKGTDFGWYGVLAGALDRADIFGRFTEREVSALARVAAECVAEVMAEECNAEYLPGPGRGSLRCSLHRGHPGKHVSAPARVTTGDVRTDRS